MAMLMVTEAAAVSITRGPILENPDAAPGGGGETHATLSWWTDVAGDAAIDYGMTAAYGQTATQAQQGSCEVGAAGTCHSITLASLTPNTTYHYQLRMPNSPSGNLVLMADQTFTTFGTAASPAASVKIAVIGDWGCKPGSNCNTFYNPTPAQQVANTVATFGPQVLATVGDNFYDSGLQGEVDQGLAYYAATLPHAFLLPVVGNHDLVSAPYPGAPYYKTLHLPRNGTQAEKYWSADVGDIHLIGLDCENWDSGQQAWLDADLIASRNSRWKFALCQHLLYTCAVQCSGTLCPPCNVATTCSPGLSATDFSLRAILAPRWEAWGIDVAFAGDNHSYDRFAPIDDFRQVCTGGTNAGNPCRTVALDCPGGTACTAAAGTDGRSTRYIVTGGGGAGGLEDSCGSTPGHCTNCGTDANGHGVATGCTNGPGATYCSFGAQQHGWEHVEITVANDCTATVQAVKYDGSILDAGFSVTKCAPTTTTTISTTTSTTLGGPTTTSTTTTTTSTTLLPGTTRNVGGGSGGGGVK